MDYYFESQIKDFFKEVIESKIGKTINILSRDELLATWGKDKILPAYAYSQAALEYYPVESFTYTAVDLEGREHEENLRVVDAMPLSYVGRLTVVTDDIQVQIQHEDLLKETIGLKRDIFINTPKDPTNRIKISLKPTDNFIRRNKNEPGYDDLYELTIEFSVNGAIDFYDEYHPAEVSYDKQLQLDLAKKLNLLCKHKIICKYKFEDQEQEKEAERLIDSLSKALEITWKTYDDIVAVTGLAIEEGISVTDAKPMFANGERPHDLTVYHKLENELKEIYTYKNNLLIDDIEQQISTLEKVCDLFEKVDKTEEQIKQNPEAKAKIPPEPQKVRRVYDKPVSNLKWKWTDGFLPAVICFVAIIVTNILPGSIWIWLHMILIMLGLPASLVYGVYKYIKYFMKKREDVSNLGNTPEYQNYRRQLDEQYDAQDAQAMSEYKKTVQKLEEEAAEKNKIRDGLITEKQDYENQIDQIKNDTNILRRQDSGRDAAKMLGFMKEKKWPIVKAFAKAHNLGNVNYEYKVNYAIMERERQAKEDAERWEREQEEYEREMLRREQEQYYEEAPRSSSGGFIRDVASTAIGASIANRGIEKEMKRQREADERRERQEKEDRKRREFEERERKREEAYQSQREWRAVQKANEERRRKGQPELPLPPRKWY